MRLSLFVLTMIAGLACALVAAAQTPPPPPIINLEVSANSRYERSVAEAVLAELNSIVGISTARLSRNRTSAEFNAALLRERPKLEAARAAIIRIETRVSALSSQAVGVPREVDADLVAHVDGQLLTQLRQHKNMIDQLLRDDRQLTNIHPYSQQLEMAARLERLPIFLSATLYRARSIGLKGDVGGSKNLYLAVSIAFEGEAEMMSAVISESAISPSVAASLRAKAIALRTASQATKAALDGTRDSVSPQGSEERLKRYDMVARFDTLATFLEAVAASEGASRSEVGQSVQAYHQSFFELAQLVSR